MFVCALAAMAQISIAKAAASVCAKIKYLETVLFHDEHSMIRFIEFPLKLRSLRCYFAFFLFFNSKSTPTAPYVARPSPRSAHWPSAPALQAVLHVVARNIKAAVCAKIFRGLDKESEGCLRAGGGTGCIQGYWPSKGIKRI